MVPPFDYRTVRGFWGIADQEFALRLHTVLGGTPGYRDLTDSVPQSMVELDRWLIGHVLNPAHALFGETDYLLREDPTITDRALYQSVRAGRWRAAARQAGRDTSDRGGEGHQPAPVRR